MRKLKVKTPAAAAIRCADDEADYEADDERGPDSVPRGWGEYINRVPRPAVCTVQLKSAA